MFQRQDPHWRDDKSVRKADRICRQRSDCRARLSFGERATEGMILYLIVSVTFQLKTRR